MTRMIVAGLGLSLFAILSVAVANYEPLTFDLQISQAIYTLRLPGLTKFLTAITYTANWQAITLICILLLSLGRTRMRYGLPLALSAVTSTVIYDVLKRVFERSRPDLSLHLIQQGGFSFPSGHAMTSMIFGSVLMLLLRLESKSRREKTLWTTGVALWILLIGFSRVYLGVHYPTDILGGWSLGLCVVLLSEQIAQRISHIRSK